MQPGVKRVVLVPNGSSHGLDPTMVDMDLKKSLQYSPLDDGDMLRVHAHPASVIPDGPQSLHGTQNNVGFEKQYGLIKSVSHAVETGTTSSQKQQKSGHHNQNRPKADVKEIWVPRQNLKLVSGDAAHVDQISKDDEREQTDNWTAKTSTTMTSTKGPFSKSDLDLYRRPESASSDTSSISRNKSLAERLRGFGQSAGKVLQRAFSMEHIYRPQRKEIEDNARTAAVSVSPSNEATRKKGSLVLIKGVKLRMSKKGKKSPTMPNNFTTFRNSWSNNAWDEPGMVNGKRHSYTWGQLLQQNLDGSQVIELSRATGKPFGFFVARGRVKTTRGIFVSRMQDENTSLRLAGLLQVGDEILEIEGADVRAADILEVNRLMANKHTLLLTVLPYVCRKDI